MERVLDFIYGEPLGDCAPQDVIPLLKIADVLQCSALHNQMIGIMETYCEGGFTVESFLKSAIHEFELPNIAEALVDLIPLSQLTAIEFDLCEVDDLQLTRAIARRMRSARMVQWDLFAGHGQVVGSSVSITLPNYRTKTSRKGLWVHASTACGVHAGLQTWKFRIDHLPSSSTEYWGMIFGLAGGPTPDVTKLKETVSLAYMFDVGAHFAFFGVGDEGRYRWLAYSSIGAATWIRSPQLGMQPGVVVLRPGDIITVKARFANLHNNGHAECYVNEDLLCCLRDRLVPGPHSACIELNKHDYEFASIGATLIQHTLDCRQACVVADQ